jgi:integrase/recombinase XerD
VIEDVKARGLDPYVVLQEWVTHLHQRGKAPKTIHSTVSSIKGFLVDSDIDVSAEKIRSKVTMPKAYETSVDRAPTGDEIRRILLRSKLDTKAAVTVMATSGLRIGELCSMRVSDIHFGDKDEPSKITLRAAVTKSRRKRITFCSGEATEFLKEHLGVKVNDPNQRIFRSEDSIYCKIMRALILAGLRVKEDADSTRYSLHPHVLRKYFYTNMLASSVDRGIVKGFMGHSIDLDGSYLRMTDEELKAQWLKGADRMTFLSPVVNGSIKSRLEERDSKIERLEARLAKLEAVTTERLTRKKE